MHWRLVLQEEILYPKMQPSESQLWRNIHFNGISLIRVNCYILVTSSFLWTKVCHNSCSCETLESNFVSILSYPLLCAIWCFWHLSSREFVLCWNAEKQRTYHLLSTRQNFRSNSWLEMIFILVGTSYTRSELPIITGSFISPSIKGSQESGLFLLKFPTWCRNFRWTSKVLCYFRSRALGKLSLDRPVWPV